MTKAAVEADRNLIAERGLAGRGLVSRAVGGRGYPTAGQVHAEPTAVGIAAELGGPAAAAPETVVAAGQSGNRRDSIDEWAMQTIRTWFTKKFAAKRGGVGKSMWGRKRERSFVRPPSYIPVFEAPIQSPHLYVTHLFVL